MGFSTYIKSRSLSFLDNQTATYDDFGLSITEGPISQTFSYLDAGGSSSANGYYSQQFGASGFTEDNSELDTYEYDSDVGSASYSNSTKIVWDSTGFTISYTNETADGYTQTIPTSVNPFTTTFSASTSGITTSTATTPASHTNGFQRNFFYSTSETQRTFLSRSTVTTQSSVALYLTSVTNGSTVTDSSVTTTFQRLTTSASTITYSNIKTTVTASDFRINVFSSFYVAQTQTVACEFFPEPEFQPFLRQGQFVAVGYYSPNTGTSLNIQNYNSVIDEKGSFTYTRRSISTAYASGTPPYSPAVFSQIAVTSITTLVTPATITLDSATEVADNQFGFASIKTVTGNVDVVTTNTVTYEYALPPSNGLQQYSTDSSNQYSTFTRKVLQLYASVTNSTFCGVVDQSQRNTLTSFTYQEQYFYTSAVVSSYLWPQVTLFTIIESLSPITTIEDRVAAVGSYLERSEVGFATQSITAGKFIFNFPYSSAYNEIGPVSDISNVLLKFVGATGGNHKFLPKFVSFFIGSTTLQKDQISSSVTGVTLYQTTTSSGLETAQSIYQTIAYTVPSGTGIVASSVTRSYAISLTSHGGEVMIPMTLGQPENLSSAYDFASPQIPVDNGVYYTKQEGFSAGFRFGLDLPIVNSATSAVNMIVANATATFGFPVRDIGRPSFVSGNLPPNGNLLISDGFLSANENEFAGMALAVPYSNQFPPSSTWYI